MRLSQLSLRVRLLAASFLVVVLFTLAIGLALERAFRASLEAGVTENLQLQIYNLLSVAEFRDGSLQMPELLQDDRFNDPQSGSLAVVSSNQALWWKSESTRWRAELDQFLRLPELEAGEFQSGVWRLDEQSYFYRRFLVLWEGRNEQVIPMQFSILQTQAPYLAQLDAFRYRLWSWLGSLAIVLVLTWLLVLKWGLTPLSRMAQELARVESGQQRQLKDTYPSEIEPVTKNLNAVLAAEQSQRQRYQQTLADLAHSLKTPLAVLRQGELDADQQDQVERMDQLVAYQLNRAVVSTGSGYVGTPVPIQPAVHRLTRALSRVYPETEFSFSETLSDSLIRMDEKDLMEILGNLLENACKYGRSRVFVETHADRISIADDGPGIPEQEQEQILQRGIRLDNLNRGQGIGLAIVTDILTSYGYDLSIGRSEWQGALFTIHLH